MSDAPRYDIATIQDFAKVPEDRLNDCLREFSVWVRMGHGLAAMLTGIPVDWPESFVWVDDDRHHIDVKIRSADGSVTIPVASGTMRGFR
jgi:hypothetical protein